MSLESAIADLVSASTSLVSAVNVTRTTLENTEAAVAAQVQPAAASATEAANQATAASNSVTAAKASLTTAMADYAAQKTAKGLPAVQSAADSELADRLHRRDPARYPFRGARPSLVLDFVRRECHKQVNGELQPFALGDVMSFTRSSTATYTGPDGLLKTAGVNEPRYDYDPVTGECRGLLVEEQRTNLTTFSSAPISTGWSVAGGYIQQQTVVAPDGTLTGFKLVESSLNELHEATCLGYTNSDTFVTFSVYIKPAGRNYAYLRLNGNSKRAAIMVDLTNKTFTVTNWQNTQNTSGSVTSVGGGWLRVVITTQSNYPTAPGFDSARISAVPTYPAAVDVAGGGFAYQGDGVSGIYIWGAQVEAGSFPTSYIPTPATFTGRASTKTYFDSNGVLQTAASDVAVTDYGYVDGRWVSKGLSLEGQATNLALKSSTVEPLVSTATVETNVLSAPDGSTTADKLVSVTTVQPRCEKNIAVPVTDTQYTYSFFAKRGSSDFVSAAHFSGLVTTAAVFNIVLGTVVSTVGTGCVARITSVGNDWFRCSITFTVLASSTYNYFKTIQTDGTAFDVGTVGGYVYLWGFQIETGPVATSYIPTTIAQVTRAADTSTSAQVTRGADNAVASGLGGTNSSAGTVTIGITGAKTPSGYLLEFNSDGVTQDRLAMRLEALNQIKFFNIRSSDASPSTLVTIPAGAGAKTIAAMSYAGVSSSAAVTGSSVAPITSMTGPHNKNYSKLILGYGAPGYLNGTIQKVTFFPRALSDTDLQALTILEN